MLNQYNATASDIATYIAAGVERLYASGARKYASPFDASQKEEKLLRAGHCAQFSNLTSNSEL